MIKGIEVCGENGRVNAVADLIGRKGLSDAVKLVATQVLGREPLTPQDIVRKYVEQVGDAGTNGVADKFKGRNATGELGHKPTTRFRI